MEAFAKMRVGEPTGKLALEPTGRFTLAFLLAGVGEAKEKLAVEALGLLLVTAGVLLLTPSWILPEILENGNCVLPTGNWMLPRRSLPTGNWMLPRPTGNWTLPERTSMTMRLHAVE
jgi:hypothetical protein